MQNLDIIEINDEQAYNAKLLASAMSNPQRRKRGMIDMLGISCAINYLYAKKIKIDTSRSVYKIPLLFEEFKISDIYHGNYRIDVITLFKEKNIKIPKIHVDMDILPHFYFIVQVGSKIREAKMIGFINSKDIAKCSCDSKYYYPTLDMILDINQFRNLTKHSIASRTLLGKHIDCMGLFLKFIDNDLSSVYKRQLIQHLMNCDSCRARFIDTIEFEKLANNIRFYPDLVRRHETRTQTQNVAVEMTDSTQFKSFEDGLKNVVISEKPKNVDDAFIDIYSDENDVDSASDGKDGENAKPKTVQMFDLLLDKKPSSKKVIDTIFNEKISKINLSSLRTIGKTRLKRAFLLTIVLIFIVGSFVLISSKGTSEIAEENQEIANFEEFDEYNDYNQYNQYNENEMGENYSQNYQQTDGEAILIPKNQSIEDFVIKNPVETKATYSPTITKISWEAPESLVRKANYTKFLQLIGKNVKLNLQNDLLLVNDIPINKVVKVDINIATNGNVNAIKMVSSSGSPSIDASVKKVINDTLSYMKPPSHGIAGKSATATLTIELN